MIRLLSVVLSIVLLVSACSKEDQIEIPGEFPVVLIPERVEVRSQTRLFVNNVEIKDEDIIHSFEEKVNLNTMFETPLLSGFMENNLVFTSEDRAAFKHNEFEMPETFDMKRKGNRFLFYSNTKIEVNPAILPSADNLGYLHSMLKYKDKLTEALPNGNRITSEVRVAHGNFKVLKVSSVAYALHLYKNSMEKKMKGLIFNEFDEDVIKFLGPTDTLAVKEYSIIYSLKK